MPDSTPAAHEDVQEGLAAENGEPYVDRNSVSALPPAAGQYAGEALSELLRPRRGKCETGPPGAKTAGRRTLPGDGVRYGARCEGTRDAAHRHVGTERGAPPSSSNTTPRRH